MFPTEWWKRSEAQDPLGAVTTTWFDKWKSVTKASDPLARTEIYAYDGWQRKVYEAQPASDSFSYTYDNRSNLLSSSHTPAPGAPGATQPIVTSIAYVEGPSVMAWQCANLNVCNRPASETDALSAVSTYTWNSGTGQLTQLTKPADVNGAHPIYSWQYNAQGLLIQAVDPTGVTTTHAYDGSGNLTATTTAAAAANGQPALNLTTSFNYYTPQGDFQAEVDPRGNSYQVALDAMRRITFRGNPTAGSHWLALSYFNYDLNGRPTGEYKANTIDANNNVTGWQVWQTAYTPTGKVATKTDPLGHVTLTQYDALDRVSRVIDPTGIINGFAYDAAGQKTQECKAIGTPLQQGCWPAGQSGAPAYASYTYSPNGQPITEIDARGNVTSTAYDGFDRVKRVTYADNSFEQNDYDPNGNVLTLTTRAGLQIRSTYDALNRRISELGWNSAANGLGYQTDYWGDIRNTSFVYDLAGRITSANNDQWPLAWTYDAAGRPITHTQNTMTSSTAYDAAGDVVMVGHADGSFESFEYDSLNRMTTAKFNGATVATLGYDTLSRRTNVAFQDGSAQGYGYDGADRLTALAHTFPNSTGANVTFTYGYDAAGRSTSKSSSNGAYLDSPPASSTSYATANALNQYGSVGGIGQGYATSGALGAVAGHVYFYYDEKLNLRQIGDSTSPAYRVDYFDAFNRRWVDEHGHSDGTHQQTYSAYDATRPEVRSEFSLTAVADWSSFTGIGWRNYVLGPNPDERLAFEDVNGTIYYPHTDRQGTTIAVSTGGQNVLTRTYGPYGEPRQTVNEVAPGASAYPYLYTGQAYDPTFGGCAATGGLYHYKARAYDAACGRFLQPDPIGTKDDENLYTYTHNDPLDHTDPTGNDALAAIGGFFVAAGEDAGAAVVGGFTAVAAPIVVGVGAFLAPSPLADGTLHGVTVSEARSKPDGPSPDADGRPHSVPDGRGGYTTYGPRDPITGQPQSTKQYRPAPGKPHGPVQRPNVKDRPAADRPDGAKVPGKPVVRPPQPGESPPPPQQPPPKPPGS